MADEIIKKIKFVADLSSLADSMRNLGQELKQQAQNMRITIPIDIGATGGMGGGGQNPSGTIWGPSGTTTLNQPAMATTMATIRQMPEFQYLQKTRTLSDQQDTYTGEQGGKKLVKALQEKVSQGSPFEQRIYGGLSKHIEKLNKDYEANAKVIDRFSQETDKAKVNFEKLNKAIDENIKIDKQRKDAAQEALGGSAPGGPGGIFGSGITTQSAIMGAAEAVRRSLGMPLSRLEARGMVGEIASRDIQASGDLSFSSYSRLDPEARRQASNKRFLGQFGSVFSGMMVGGGGGLVASGGNPFVGAGGAIAGGAERILSGAASSAGSEAYERALSAYAQQQGFTKEAFDSYIGRQKERLPYIQRLGVDPGRYRGTMMGQLSGNYYTEDQTMAGVEAGLGGGGGHGFGIGNIGGLNYLSRTAGMMPGQMGGFLGMMAGAGGANDPNANMDLLSRAVAKGTALGFKEAPQMQRFLQTTSSIMSQFGQGFGASGGRASLDITGAAIGVLGDTVQGLQAAGSAAGAMQSEMTAGGGLEGYANIQAVDKVMGARFGKKWQEFQRSKPRQAALLMQYLQKAGPGALETKEVHEFLKNSGFSGFAGMDEKDFQTMDRDMIATKMQMSEETANIFNIGGPDASEEEKQRAATYKFADKYGVVAGTKYAEIRRKYREEIGKNLSPSEQKAKEEEYNRKVAELEKSGAGTLIKRGEEMRYGLEESGKQAFTDAESAFKKAGGMAATLMQSFIDTTPALQKVGTEGDKAAAALKLLFETISEMPGVDKDKLNEINEKALKKVEEGQVPKTFTGVAGSRDLP